MALFTPQETMMVMVDRQTATGQGRQIDVDAAANAIAYIAGRVSNPSFHKVFKVLYLAEKDHLSRHGRTIVGDTYIAMKYGPVPSAIYDGLKALKGTAPADPDLADLVVRLGNLVHVNGSQLTPIGEPDLDWLSDSDVECLDECIKNFGTKSFRELSVISHDDAWSNAPTNGVITVESLVDSLPNAEVVHSYLRGEDDD